MMIRVYFSLLFSFVLFHSNAQIDFDQLPKSFALETIDYDVVPTFEGEAIDVEALIQEDIANEGNWMRSGITKPVSKDLSNSGRWFNHPEGGRVWLIKLRAPNALATSVYLKNLFIPNGGYLSIFSPDKEVVRGAFDSRSFHQRGNFTHDDIPGEELIIELFEPANAIRASTLSIESLCYMYIMPEHLLKTSGACNVDVNCSEGNAWEAQKKSVVRIKTYKGGWVGWCSGTLMNNTDQDCRPLILTAWHCGLGNGFSDPVQNDLDNYIFYFNYERSVCGGGTFQNDQVLGCSMLGNSQDGGGDNGSDFMLVELNMDVPWDYHVYYAGWDATNNGSNSGITMHHPSGDYKKISTYTAPTVSDAYGTATGSHWRVSWVATTNGHGVTEGGSSGSPLFNSQGNVIGQLTGGGASCSNPTSPDLYGKMYYNWNSNIGVGGDALQPLLDPSNSGVQYLYGTYPPCLAGIEESLIALENVKVYPNPSSGILNVYSPDMTTYELGVHSMDGRVVYQKSIFKQEEISFDLSFLTQGVYVVQIHSGQGRISRKIVLE